MHGARSCCSFTLIEGICVQARLLRNLRYRPNRVRRRPQEGLPEYGPPAPSRSPNGRGPEENVRKKITRRKRSLGGAERPGKTQALRHVRSRRDATGWRIGWIRIWWK